MIVSRAEHTLVQCQPAYATQPKIAQQCMPLVSCVTRQHQHLLEITSWMRMLAATGRAACQVEPVSLNTCMPVLSPPLPVCLYLQPLQRLHGALPWFPPGLRNHFHCTR
jgi:hypothetical protein